MLPQQAQAAGSAADERREGISILAGTQDDSQLFLAVWNRILDRFGQDRRFSGILWSMTAVSKTDVRQIVREETADLRTDVAKLKTDVSTLKTDVSKLQTDVAVLKVDVAEMKDDMKEVKSTTNTILNKVDRFLKQVDDEKDERTSADALLERRIETLEKQQAR
ncbi:MAG: hypothetical protein G01um1014106_613 [Parcubacteria group bacterium Gr01-1014_106]|nr:MAG: hypothetical protein G01um1014106_613 [Parcubacteria group bacterium Gr01-1014_106]